MKLLHYLKKQKLITDKKRKQAFHIGGEFKTKDYLDEVLSEKLKQSYNMEYDGAYSWHSSWENDRRKVVQLFLVKGDKSFFTWGYEFKLFPEVGNGKVRYYKTHIQLREMPKRIIEATDFDHIFDLPMHADNRSAIKTEIQAVWDRTLPEITLWFQRISTDGEILDELDRRKSNNTSYYKMMTPVPDHIKAYIFAKQGKKEKAIELIKLTEAYNRLPDAEQSKMLKRLMSY